MILIVDIKQKYRAADSDNISPDMLFGGLFIASSPKFDLENPDWYMEWLGTVEGRYPAYHSDLRTPPPPSAATPPSPHRSTGLINFIEPGKVL